MIRKHIIPSITVILLSIVIFTSTNCKNSTEPKDQDTLVTVFKPNIYLYPETIQQLSVLLDFPKGGFVTISDPEYQNGWNVTVDPNGLIDNKYGFLFYECKVPDSWQYKYGWFVNKTNFEEFFTNNLESYGFLGKEIEDFINYWLPIFSDYDNLIVYPQVDSEIEELIVLKIINQPNSIRRLFYVITDYSSQIKIPLTPIFNSINREGFTVMEWGVILK
ncbi:MAG: hypothetical protein L3J41_09870 [Melioribacteraceae bacterium]|nr:hypothetical protein [Melioribacteraceae bacterium]